MITVAVYNIKGGVGKTTTAVNLAYLSARNGLNTLLWDLDPQAAATYCFRVRPKVKGGRKALVRGKQRLGDLIKGSDFEGLDILPADFTYRKMDLELEDIGKPERRFRKLLRPLAKQYQRIYLDCPPGITLSAESVFGAADALVVPLIPTTLSLRTLEQLSDFLESSGTGRPAVYPFYTMVDRRRRTHRALTDTHDERFLATRIPYASEVEHMADERAPLLVTAPRSRAAAAYQSLWLELEAKLAE